MPDGSVDLVWCREVLSHVPALDVAFAEMRRVLRDGGRALVYQMCATERLRPGELGGFDDHPEPAAIEAGIAAAGLLVDECLVFGSEWGERAEEDAGQGTRRLLHAARLLRSPERYVARYGQGRTTSCWATACGTCTG